MRNNAQVKSSGSSLRQLSIRARERTLNAVIARSETINLVLLYVGDCFRRERHGRTGAFARTSRPDQLRANGVGFVCRGLHTDGEV